MALLTKIIINHIIVPFRKRNLYIRSQRVWLLEFIQVFFNKNRIKNKCELNHLISKKKSKELIKVRVTEIIMK